MKMQPEELDMVFEPLGDAIKNVANLTRSGGSQALKIRGITKEQIAVAFHALLKYVETGENFWVVIKRPTTQKKRSCHLSANCQLLTV